jgi:hypothetical protein
VDFGVPSFTFGAGDGSALSVPFALSRFERDLVEAGGWVDLADSRY